MQGDSDKYISLMINDIDTVYNKLQLINKISSDRA